jgi:hypothetical protein
MLSLHCCYTIATLLLHCRHTDQDNVDELIELNKTLVFTKDYGMMSHTFQHANWRELGTTLTLSPSHLLTLAACATLALSHSESVTLPSSHTLTLSHSDALTLSQV